MSSHQPKNQFDNLEKIWFRPVQNQIDIWVADEDDGGESDNISHDDQIMIWDFVHHDDDDCGDGGSDGEVWVEAKMLSFSWSDNRIGCWRNKRAGPEN